MSVVDRRATFVSTGRQGSSQIGVGCVSHEGGLSRRFTIPSPMMLDTATINDDYLLNERLRRQGIDTDAAKEINEIRRNMISIRDVWDKESSDKDKRRTSRRVSYGAAAIKRDVGETSIDDNRRSSKSRGRRTSVSAGEGKWLVKDNVKRRKSSIGKPKETTTLNNIEGPGKSSIFTKQKRQIRNSERKVHFTTVSVRHYPIILGNNPFVTSGPSLELAWEYESSMNEMNIPLDSYEAFHAPIRRSEWDLALSRGERESQLLESGFTREEIATAIRETSRIKSQRAQTALNIKMEALEEFTENARRRGMEILGLRKNPDWLYNEWKLSTSPSGSPANIDAKRAGSIFRREGDRAAASAAAELASSIEKNTKIFGSVVRRVVRRLPSVDRDTTIDAISSKDEDEGPPFGITRKSFSAKFSSAGNDRVRDNNNEGLLCPFAVIKVVYPNSPAHEANLRRGDRIIKLGNISALNHNHCRALPELGQVAAKKESTLLVIVEDGYGNRRTCNIKPREWNGGRGHFGFLVRELGAA